MLPPSRHSGKQPARLAWLLLAGPLLVLWLQPDARRWFLPPPFADSVHSSHAPAWFDDEADVELLGEWRTDGLWAVPGEDSRLRVAAGPGPWDGGTIVPGGEAGSRWIVNVSVRPPEDSAGTINSQTFFDVESGVGVKLDGEAGSVAGSPVVEIRPAEAGSPLRKVDVRFAARGLDRIPHLPDFVALALAPFLFASFLQLVFGLGGRRAIAGGAGAGLLAAAVVRMGVAEPGIVAALTTGVAAASGLQALAAAKGVSPRRAIAGLPDLRGRGLWLVGTAIVLGALLVRWGALVEARRTPLSSDAIGYAAIARDAVLYATRQTLMMPDIREPLFPWIIQLWLAFAPDNEASLRFLALVLGVGAVAAVAAAGVRLFGGFVGLAAAAFLAFSPSWAEQAVRLLRLDLIVLLLMGLLAAAVWRRDDRGPGPAGLIGALCGALVLTRLGFLLLAVVALANEGVRRRWKPPSWIVAAALAFLPLVPHLVYNFQETGDALYSSNIHTAYYRNRDAALDAPDPAAAMRDFNAEPYAGGAFPAAKWILGEHSILAAAGHHVRGAWLLFVWDGPRVHLFRGWEILMLPGLLGLWELWRRRQLWVAAWFVAATLPAWFVASKGADWRIGAEAQVLAAWLWALGLVFAGRQAIAFVRHRRGLPLEQPNENAPIDTIPAG